MLLWLMEAAPLAQGQPLYRPFMILSLVTLAVIAAAVWFLWQHPPEQDEVTLIDKFRELIRAIVIAEFGAGFVILTLEGKIEAAIFANTVGIIIAFLFGQQQGQRKQPQNGGTKP
jgi:cobalamin synthase